MGQSWVLVHIQLNQGLGWSIRVCKYRRLKRIFPMSHREESARNSSRVLAHRLALLLSAATLGDPACQLIRRDKYYYVYHVCILSLFMLLYSHISISHARLYSYITDDCCYISAAWSSNQIVYNIICTFCFHPDYLHFAYESAWSKM